MRHHRSLIVGIFLGHLLFFALPRHADAALVICKKGKRVSLRETACKRAETLIPASDLGVTGPPGPPGQTGQQGIQGPGAIDAFSTWSEAQVLLTSTQADIGTLALGAGRYVVSASLVLLNLDSANGEADCRVALTDGGVVSGNTVLIIGGSERTVGISGASNDNRRVYVGQGTVELTAAGVLHLQCLSYSAVNVNAVDGVLTAMRVGTLTYP